jgi:hypothetical protein
MQKKFRSNFKMLKIILEGQNYESFEEKKT